MATPNLGLTTFNTASGSATTFLQFRLAIADASSNMSIIDDYAGGMSASILSLQGNAVNNVSATLVSGAYYEGSAPLMTNYGIGGMINLTLDTTVASGSPTLNINSLGTLGLKKIDTSGCAISMGAGDMIANRYYMFTYDGTQYILTNNQVADIVGSGVMSTTSGSSVVHNASGITTGSYNKVQVDTYGHVTAGSQISYQTVSSISGSGVMSDTTGSGVKHNLSGIVSGSYTRVQVDVYGHITSASAIVGLSGSRTFYSASASGGDTIVFNTVDISQGLITSWTQV